MGKSISERTSDAGNDSKADGSSSGSGRSISDRTSDAGNDSKADGSSSGDGRSVSDRTRDAKDSGSGGGSSGRSSSGGSGGGSSGRSSSGGSGGSGSSDSDGGDSGARERINKGVDKARERVTSGAESVGERVSDAAEPVTETVGEVRDFVQSGDNEPSVGDDDFGRGIVDTGGGRERSPTESRQPTVGEKTSNTVPVSETRQTEAEVNEGVVEGLSDGGGLLSERPGANDGLLPGEVAGVDISEQRTQGLAERGRDFEQGVDDSGFVGSVAAGVAGFGADVASLPQTAESGAEAVENAPGVIDEYGVGETFGTVGSVGINTVQAAGEEAFADPVRFGTGAGLGYLSGAAAGRVAGQAASSARSATTRIGGERIDPTEITNPETARYYDGDVDVGAEARFPGADNPELYRSDPPAAVRQQAGEYTPEAIEDAFGQAGVGEGTDLKKAVDTNPEGPGTGRGNTGFQTQEGSYESPGGFVGPELSPNFLGLDDGRSFSFRPGLPDTGSNPTGVVVRTDVDSPDARNLDEFNSELLDREGETTARTKPASEVNEGEIEAVIPPESEFAPVRSGGFFSGARDRLGIGSDFYTEFDGQPVELQLAADPDLFGQGGRAGAADVDAGDVGDVGDSAAGRSGPAVDDLETQPASYYASPGEAGVDRALPGTGVGSVGAGTFDSRDSGGIAVDDQPTGYNNPFDDREVDAPRTPDSDSPRSRSDRAASTGRSSPSRPPSSRVDSSVPGSVFGIPSSGASVPSARSSSPFGSSGSSPIFGGSGGFGGSSGGSSGGSGSSGGGSGGGGSGGGGSPMPPSPPNPPGRAPERPEPEREPAEPLPLFGDDPETPEFLNPVASGADDLLFY